MEEPNILVRQSLAALFGFACTALTFGYPLPDILLRKAALAFSNAWIGISLFYLIALLGAYLWSSLVCRLLSRTRGRLGVSFVLGSAAFSLLVGGLTVGTYSSCPLFGMCGTGDELWYFSTAAIPEFSGKVLALRAGRGPTDCGAFG